MHVDISVPLGESLIVPRSSIVDNGQSRYVFVDKGEGRLQVRHVEVGPELDQGVVILEGLKEGERVVDNGTFLIDSEAQLKSSFRQFGHDHGSGNEESHEGHSESRDSSPSDGTSNPEKMNRSKNSEGIND